MERIELDGAAWLERVPEGCTNYLVAASFFDRCRRAGRIGPLLSLCELWRVCGAVRGRLPIETAATEDCLVVGEFSELCELCAGCGDIPKGLARAASGNELLRVDTRVTPAAEAAGLTAAAVADGAFDSTVLLLSVTIPRNLCDRWVGQDGASYAVNPAHVVPNYLFLLRKQPREAASSKEEEETAAKKMATTEQQHQRDPRVIEKTSALLESLFEAMAEELDEEERGGRIIGDW